MTNETIEGSQEFNVRSYICDNIFEDIFQDQFFSERSTASGPVSPMESFQKKRKHRPLSAPVNLPSEVDQNVISYITYLNFKRI